MAVGIVSEVVLVAFHGKLFVRDDKILVQYAHPRAGRPKHQTPGAECSIRRLSRHYYLHSCGESVDITGPFAGSSHGYLRLCLTSSCFDVGVCRDVPKIQLSHENIPI